MKLLCITKGPMFSPAIGGHWVIKFMETYNSIAEHELVPYGKYYVLAEDPNYGYAEEHFVVLPDDEEKESAEEIAHLDKTFRDLVHEVENA